MTWVHSHCPSGKPNEQRARTSSCANHANSIPTAATVGLGCALQVGERHLLRVVLFERPQWKMPKVLAVAVSQ